MVIRMNDKSEAVQKFQSAASCFKKVLPMEAIKALEQAAEILIESGRFHTAANVEKEIAEIYENEIVDLEKSKQHYLKSAEWFIGEDSPA